MTAPPLTVMLAAARSELEAETPIQINTSHASKTEDADGRIDADEGGIGLPFTERFHRLLTIRSRPRQTEYLMRGSLDEVDEWCRIQHPNHVQDGEAELWRRPLCAQVIILAVRGGYETPEIAFMVLYPEPVVRSLLIGALQHAASWRQARSTARRPTAADVVIGEIDRRIRHRAERGVA